MEDLESLPRKALQALAKSNGIKANQKSADIISALRNIQRAAGTSHDGQVSSPPIPAQDVTSLEKESLPPVPPTLTEELAQKEGQNISEQREIQMEVDFMFEKEKQDQVEKLDTEESNSAPITSQSEDAFASLAVPVSENLQRIDVNANVGSIMVEEKQQDHLKALNAGETDTAQILLVVENNVASSKAPVHETSQQINLVDCDAKVDVMEGSCVVGSEGVKDGQEQQPPTTNTLIVDEAITGTGKGFAKSLKDRRSEVLQQRRTSVPAKSGTVPTPVLASKRTPASATSARQMLTTGRTGITPSSAGSRNLSSHYKPPEPFIPKKSTQPPTAFKPFNLSTGKRDDLSNKSQTLTLYPELQRSSATKVGTENRRPTPKLTPVKHTKASAMREERFTQAKDMQRKAREAIVTKHRAF